MAKGVLKVYSSTNAGAGAGLAFLSLVDGEDLAVKRASLLTLNAIVHSKPHIAGPLLGEMLPKVYRESIIRPELIRKVQLGPFSVPFDDGLPSRKAAYECLDTLCASAVLAESLLPEEFLGHLASGLGDDYDVKMLSHLILAKYMRQHPAQVRGSTRILCRRTAPFTTLPCSSPRPAWCYPKILVLTPRTPRRCEH